MTHQKDAGRSAVYYKHACDMSRYRVTVQRYTIFISLYLKNGARQRHSYYGTL